MPRLKTFAACAVYEWFEREFCNHGEHDCVENWPAIGTRAWQIFGKKLYELAWDIVDVYGELNRYYRGYDDEYLSYAVKFCQDYYTDKLFNAQEMKRHGSWDMPFRERPLSDFLDDFIRELDFYILNVDIDDE